MLSSHKLNLPVHHIENWNPCSEIVLIENHIYLNEIEANWDQKINSAQIAEIKSKVGNDIYLNEI